MNEKKSPPTKIFIKNMVCRHCMESVLGVFKRMNLEVVEIKLGEALVQVEQEAIDYPLLQKELNQQGFELLQDRELQLVEKIKTAIIYMVHHADELPDVKNSVFLSEKTGVSYAYLSKLFSKHTHLTIEKYIILQKIERAKELLSYGELNVSEIAYDLGYRSVQHLSNQFKSVTGMSVSQFKKLEEKERKPLSEL
ncbi:MAG: helix-turn-helix transcriptional regulator [Bacteroidetes bacterium]|nr:helix-turn-helix transcriptional regulator [Bacteroidota bacterium]